MFRSLPCSLVALMSYSHTPYNVTYSVILLNGLSWVVLEAGPFPYLLPPTLILKTMSDGVRVTVQLIKYLQTQRPDFCHQDPHEEGWAWWPALVISALQG